MKLSEQVNAQIAALTERTEKLKSATRRVDYMLAITGVIALVVMFLPYAFSMELSTLDIPATLLLNDSSAVGNDRLDIAVESAASGLMSIITKLMPIIAVMSGMSALYSFVRGNLNMAFSSMMMAVVTLTAPAIFGTALGGTHEGAGGKEYVNNSVMSQIIDYDESEPISQDYIGKVSRVDERYVLAQVAILSEASYPSSFFKTVAGDLSKESTFKPTEEALYSIEMTAYGHPETEAIAERANTLSGYVNAAATVGFVAQMMFVMLFIGGAGLKLLRLSINKRLKAILQMVSGTQDNGEVA